MPMTEPIYRYTGADHPQAYEYLNVCTDPDQLVEKLMWNIAPWAGRVLLDLGAGSGFHVPRFSEKADRVIAVEPDPKLRQQMLMRFKQDSSGRVSVIAGSAESIPLRDNSIDVAQARYAYFFGTDDCLPGISEVRRVMKPGSHFFIVDVIPGYGKWGELAREAYPKVFPHDYHQKHSSFFTRNGFTTHELEAVFRAPSKEIMRKVFEMDFPHKAEAFMEKFDTLELGYGIAVYHTQKE